MRVSSVELLDRTRFDTSWVSCPLTLGPLQTGQHALSDHGAFKLGEHAIIWNIASPEGVVVSMPCW
jgi:hypothetical protein